MKLIALEQWVCDKCNNIINSPSEGYIEWLQDENFKHYNFKIVHHTPSSPNYPNSNCYFYDGDAKKRDNSLENFVGTMGIIVLLSFLDFGYIFDEDFKNGPRVKNIREFVELNRRLMLPYYEEARFYLHKAYNDGFLGSPNEISIYLPDTLKEVILEYGK